MKFQDLMLSLAAVVSAWPSAANAATGADAAQYMAQRGWTNYDSKVRPTIPAEGIAPVMYYAKGSNVPSCGLLSGTAAAPTFVEILAAEPGEQYPQCAGINDAAAFKLAGKDYLVFEYTDLDSRNESYEQFFYVFKNKGGEYVADEKLNEEAGGPQKGKVKAADGIRAARGYAIGKAQPAMELQTRDLIADTNGAFAVFKDKASANCSFVLDNGTELGKFSSELFTARGKCLNYLASSKLDTPATTYYLGMFKGSDAATNVAVFSMAKGTAAVRAEKELAQRAVASGKVTDIKSLKAYLTATEKSGRR